MADLAALKSANLARWAKAKVIRLQSATLIARRLLQFRARYNVVAGRTGVPWYVIAVIHERESSQDFSKSLAQGDPWNRKSVHVPSGRGPFTSWEDAAVDALANCQPFLANNHDWSVAGTLLALEEYNGLGYSRRGRPSPYLWAGTDQYARGKYVADGRYEETAIDGQIGCAALLIKLMELDPSVIVPGDPRRVMPLPHVPKQEAPPIAPAEPKPAKTWSDVLASVWTAIMGRKAS